MRVPTLSLGAGLLLLVACGTSPPPDDSADSTPAASAVIVKDVGGELALFRETFNAGRNRPRFLAILSPT